VSAAQDGNDATHVGAMSRPAEPIWTARAQIGKLRAVLSPPNISFRTLSLLLPMLMFGAGCATPRQEKVPLARFEFTQPQMGLPFRLVLYAAGH